MIDVIREYSGLLKAKISESEKKRIMELAEKYGLEIDVSDSYLEFEYSGRDANRFVVKFLNEISIIIQDADGEIQCIHYTEGTDPLFEFYKIKKKNLIRQYGKIVRSNEEEILSNDFD